MSQTSWIAGGAAGLVVLIGASATLNHQEQVTSAQALERQTLKVEAASFDVEFAEARGANKDAIAQLKAKASALEQDRVALKARNDIVQASTADRGAALQATLEDEIRNTSGTHVRPTKSVEDMRKALN